MESNNLTTKLAAVMAAVHRIPKRGRNAFHGYDYATEADIVEAIRTELAERRIVLIPDCQSIDMKPHTETAKGKAQFLTTVMMKYTFMDGDSGEHFSFQMPGAGIDGEDKGCYKALTGSNKYALMKFFLLPTGDDPEHDKRKPSKEETQGLKCEDCKRVITAVTQPGGVVAPLAKVLDNGRQKWNLDLCGGCQIARAKKGKAEPAKEEEVPLKDPEVIHADSGECFVHGTVTEVFRQAANKPLVIKLDTVALSCWHKSLIEPLKLSKGAQIDVVCSVKGDFKNIEKVNRIGNIEFSDNVPVIRRDAEESLYA